VAFLPTAVFAALGVWIPWNHWDPGSPFLLIHGPLLTAVVFVPLAWYWFVARPGGHPIARGALAGATCGFLVSTLPLVACYAWSAATHDNSNDGLGALYGVFDFFFVGLGLVPCAPVGAVLGALLAGVWWHGLGDLREQPDARYRRLKDALGGAMMAILASPVVALIVGLLLLDGLRALFPRRTIGYAAMVAWTLLVTTPMAAVLGARRSDRLARTERQPG